MDNNSFAQNSSALYFVIVSQLFERMFAMKLRDCDERLVLSDAEISCLRSKISIFDLGLDKGTSVGIGCI